MSQEFEFLSVTDTSEYADKWIAVVGQKIIASGDDLKQVYKEAKEKSGKKEPLFMRVPKEQETLIL